MKAPVALAGAAAAAAVLGAFYDLDSGELTREYVVRVEAGRGATSPLADEKTVAKSSVARAPERPRPDNVDGLAWGRGACHRRPHHDRGHEL